MSDLFAVASWWLIIQIFGLAAWPLAFRLFRWLPDRGYMLTKPLGLLLVSYVLWLLASIQILPNTPLGILIALIIVFIISQWVYRRSQRPITNLHLFDWLREHRTLVIAYELVFALAFIGWAIFRAHAPDISTAEKPMEMAFINAIGRSGSFPPHDPWLAGYPIAYYYFGYVMLSMFGKLSNASAGIIFSLGNAFWFALSAASSFAVVANLILLTAQKIRAAIVFGTLGAIMLVVMGNLEAPLEVGRVLGLGTPQFWTWLDIQDLSEPYTPLPNGQIAWPLRSDEGWWWRASWLIHDYPATSISPRMAAIIGRPPDPNTAAEDLIDEFPQFSFLLGDLHPHSMNLPFVLLVIGLALNLYQAGTQGEARSLWRIPLWPTYPLILGGVSFMNTWDFPVYGFLIATSFGLGKWQTHRFRVRDSLIDLTVLVTLGLLLYLPFYRNFTSQAAGIWPNIFNGTRAPQFFLMFGPLIVIGSLFGLKLLIEAIRAGRLRLGRFAWMSIGGAVGLTGVTAIGLVGVGAVVLQLSSSTREWFNGVIAQMADRGITLTTHLLTRLSDPWVPLSLAFAIVTIVLLGRANRPSKDQAPANRLTGFILLLFLLGLLLTFATEFAYIIDIFHSRKNTLFKFYYQAWTVWSIASAYAMYYLLSGPARIRSRVRRIAANLGLATIIGLGLIYPALAIPTRIDNPVEPMLDAMLATVVDSAPNSNVRDAYAATLWLNENVAGAPIILEGTTDQLPHEPRQSRISAWTGLPTVLGWPDHEIQWRGSEDAIRQRLADVTTIYSTPDIALARSLLQKYSVSYVIVGDRERIQYPQIGLTKFAQMFPIIFRQNDVIIYRIP